jgi:hypothetical protein
MRKLHAIQSIQALTPELLSLKIKLDNFPSASWSTEGKAVGKVRHLVVNRSETFRHYSPSYRSKQRIAANERNVSACHPFATPPRQYSTEPDDTGDPAGTERTTKYRQIGLF